MANLFVMLPNRVIVHVDMDAFFASVEVLDNPELRGKPVIVGGGVSRGVVSAASYEARVFGVHSAMPMSQALRKCPQAIVLPGRMDRYDDISSRVMAILGRRTPLLEQMSVDEAYLDLTNWLPEGVMPEQAAREIQAEVLEKTGLSCSVGVASGKAIAKMASDLKKPGGLVVVPPGEEAAFLSPLSIGQLRGVGEATERKLRELGIETVGELANFPVKLLEQFFGVAGRDLYALAHGIDDSPVVPERQAKSLGREVTFAADIGDRRALERTLLELSDEVAERLRRHELLARGVTLKLRYDNFTTLTRSMMFIDPIDVADPLFSSACELLRKVNPARPVRLIGVTAGPLLPASDRQLNLFDQPGNEKRRKLAGAMDAIKTRFGEEAITRARLAKEK
ncbi:MAG: DNA polymerase IV [Armatimonadota bacterium]